MNNAIIVILLETFASWMDSVSGMVGALLDRVRSHPSVRLVEETDGEFKLEPNKDTGQTPHTLQILRQPNSQEKSMSSDMLAGKHVELLLQPGRFLFRPLELPNRASEFMSGIVQSQIDRLTPWKAAEAAFGWSQPRQLDNEKMVVTVAATIRNLIQPYVRALAEAGAYSVAILVRPPEPTSDAELIKVWEEKNRMSPQTNQIRRALTASLAIAGLLAALTVAADLVIGKSLSTQQNQVAQQIYGHSTNNKTFATEAVLERRKQDNPSLVLALETLSKILPDQTYLTELQVEGNKLRLTGMTRDAPALIGLLERSGGFTRANFFAPTTRSGSNSDDHFHIEAVLKPLGPPS